MHHTNNWTVEKLVPRVSAWIFWRFLSVWWKTFILYLIQWQGRGGIGAMEVGVQRSVLQRSDEVSWIDHLDASLEHHTTQMNI